MKTIRTITRVLTAATLITSATSCGNVVRSSRAPALLVVNSLAATRGQAQGGTAAASLASDVLTLVTTGGVCSTTNPCPTIFTDSGTITLSLAPKDIDVGLTSNNQVTVNRIHVSFRRTDGRNTEGVDVPFSFDTASTATVAVGGSTAVSFTLVRIQAKQESPLVQLVTNDQFISTIADITVYGNDIVGNAVSATGSIGVTFGNWGDF
jgi:hypothetical protein